MKKQYLLALLSTVISLFLLTAGIAYADRTPIPANTSNITAPAGVGSSTPWATFAINPLGGQANKFVIGSSTATSFVVNNAGNVGIASTSPSARFSVGQATAGFSVSSTGKILGVDTTNNFEGRISPTNHLTLQTGTTTTWTATTTGAYIPFGISPFAGTVQQIRCKTDASFLGVDPQINGSDMTPQYFVASTTVGTIKFTGSNTVAIGDKISLSAGTTTSASALTISCTLDVTETQ